MQYAIRGRGEKLKTLAKIGIDSLQILSNS